MDSLSKLLRKISSRERLRLKEVMRAIAKGERNGIPLKGSSNMYRVRVGSYRIFYTKNGKVVITDIKRRNERTYKK